jgi:hypothetical protein
MREPDAVWFDTAKNRSKNLSAQRQSDGAGSAVAGRCFLQPCQEILSHNSKEKVRGTNGNF